MNRSYVIYDGPSRIDGSPIVVIAQVGTGNRKTGAGMAQTWIVHTRESQAIRQTAGQRIAHVM